MARPVKQPQSSSDTSEAKRRVWRHCPLCDTEGGELHLMKGSLRIVCCSKCAMLFANPVAAQFAQGTFYDRIAAPFYLSPDKLESDYAPVRFARELRLFRHYCRRGSVLDVGCSTGAFLHQLATRFPGDYTTLGTDVAGPALDHAERHGVPVSRAPFLSPDFGPARFDAITFWAVLEHLAEPRAFLSQAAARLNLGGHCFILVPNMNSLAVRLLGQRYRYLMPEHLNYFTGETLKHFVAHEHALQLVAMHSMHFNPVVIWQDWRRNGEAVADADRARLLKQTTGWKQNPLLLPAKLAYSVVERLLGGLWLADNLVAVLQRR